MCVQMGHFSRKMETARMNQNKLLDVKIMILKRSNTSTRLKSKREDWWPQRQVNRNYPNNNIKRNKNRKKKLNKASDIVRMISNDITTVIRVSGWERENK